VLHTRKKWQKITPFYQDILCKNNCSWCKITSRPIPLAARSIDLGLWLLTYWDCGFEFRLGHGCGSFVDVMRCQARTGLCDGPIPLSEESFGFACERVCVFEGDQVQQYPSILMLNRETEVRIKEAERLLRG